MPAPDRLLAPGEDNIVTMLLHRSTPATAWHEGAVLYETSSAAAGLEEIAGYQGVAAHAARLGADGVLLAGSLPDPRSPAVARELGALLTGADRLGQKVVAALDPAAPDAMDRARALLRLGVDGIDVGHLRADDAALPAARELAAELRARLGRDVAITARTDAPAQDAVLAAFDADALPLLRHDQLWRAGWNAHTGRAAIASTARWFDSKRATLVWTIFAAASAADAEANRLTHEPLTPIGRRRLGAAILAMLGLPGTIVLRQGEEVGRLHTAAGDPPAEAALRVAEATAQQRGSQGSPFESYRRALHLRREMRLGTGPLSWVTLPGLPPATTLAYLNRSLLVVVNLGEEPVTIGRPDRLVHSSGEIAQDDEGALGLAPGTTAWYRLDQAS